MKALHPILRTCALAFAWTVSAIIAVPNALLHLPATPLAPRSSIRERDISAQLHYLREAIEGGAARDMQHIYPEGYFFLHAIFGLAWCDLARSSTDSALRSEALEESAMALTAIESRTGTEPFPEGLEPRHGVFWNAWTGLLRGRLLEVGGIQSDSALVRRWRGGLDSLAAAYNSAGSPFLPSYLGMSWSGDNVVAMWALASHDRLLGSARYAHVVRRWIHEFRATLDPATGLPPFEVDYPEGRVVKSARGSGQALLAWALADIDTALAREQYLRLRESFYTSRLGLPMVREFPFGTAGYGDYDSGPVIWDIGATATIVALGTARRFGDTAFAQALEASMRLFGMPLRWNGQTRYAFGQMPMADAFIAWGRTTIPQAGIEMPSWQAPWWWPMPLHLFSLLFIAISWLPWLLLKRVNTGALIPHYHPTGID